VTYSDVIVRVEHLEDFGLAMAARDADAARKITNTLLATQRAPYNKRI
jgi:hypothetical protein